MIVDSSVWLEIFFGGDLSQTCERETKKSPLYVPSIVLFEVYKKVKSKSDETDALRVVGLLSSHTLVDLTREISLLAADIAIDLKMGMADSIVLAHARYLKTTLVTLDNDFLGILDARVLRGIASP